MSRIIVWLAVAVSLGAGIIDARATDLTMPGTIPGHKPVFGERPVALPAAASGLGVIYRKYGKYRLSVSAAGDNNTSHNLKVTKPTADAVVDKAYLMAASNFNATIDNGDITLNGTPVTWMSSIFNSPTGYPNFFQNVLADVTAIVKPKVDALATAGNVAFKVVENASKNSYIDGEILVVVFKLTTGTSETVALMFGAQQLAGDRFEITLDNPIDPKAPGAVLNMGLGISFSYQENGTQQYSSITVNGQRVSTAAGGSDDGSPTNGGLITVGGLGDSLTVPADPNATPTNARSDDERYSLLKFITKTTTSIKVDTFNPSNDDNILFAYLEFSAKGDVNKDTDGDGLLDSWETSGYDHDGDGIIDVNLPALGADPKHKDLFIAYAYMAAGPTESVSHAPTTAIKNAITNAFANAPVSNPDGTTGIRVHWKSLGSVPFQQNLNLTSSNWAEFDAIMDPLVSPAQRVIYHRLLCGAQYDNSNSSGLSRGIPASDFFEALPSGLSTMIRAGTIMHELGHNLGLHHGGVDDENWKPNHLSIMSYANQFVGVTVDGSPKLDYERFDQKDLDENHLSEAAGLSLNSGSETTLSHYGVRWFNAGNGFSKATGANAAVNWNNTAPSNQTDIAVDINNGNSPPLADNKSILRAGFVEWDNLIFDGGQIGASGGAQRHRHPLNPNALKELSLDEWLEKARTMQNVK